MHSAADLPWRIELEPEEVRDRLRWARRSGHPRHLWPDVGPAAVHQGLQQLERATEAVLRGEHPVRSTDGVGARALGIAAYKAGMGPLMGYWIETDQVEAGPLVERLFALHLSHGRERAERLRLELRRSVEALNAAGIRPLIMKSGHTARVYFPEPGTRPAIDVDLVVPRDQFDLAEDALSAAGYKFAATANRPLRNTWLAPGSARLPRSLELLHAESQYALDLHDSLNRDFFGVRSLGLGDLEGVNTTTLPAVGGSAYVLPPTELLFNQALQASQGLHNLTLVRILELVFIVHQDAGDGLDWSEFNTKTEEADGWRFLYPALALAERLAPGTMDPAALDRSHHAATPSMRRILAAVSPATTNAFEGVERWQNFMWCTTPGDYLRHLAYILFPPQQRSPSQLAQRYLNFARRFARRWSSGTSAPRG